MDKDNTDMKAQLQIRRVVYSLLTRLQDRFQKQDPRIQDHLSLIQAGISTACCSLFQAASFFKHDQTRAGKARAGGKTRFFVGQRWHGQECAIASP